jgi:hypothetical protein
MLTLFFLKDMFKTEDFKLDRMAFKGYIQDHWERESD